MRISDWSSDVCSSDLYEQISVHEDLVGEPVVFLQEGMTVTIESYEEEPISVMLQDTVVMKIVEADPVVKGQTASSACKPADRKSVVSGKSAAVRVEQGGRRNSKKKKRKRHKI